MPSLWQAATCMHQQGVPALPLRAGFSPELLHATRSFAAPSPVQAQCWPILQAGRDLVGIAATGSGKTLAFGLPALKHILAQRAAGVFTGDRPASRQLPRSSAYVLVSAMIAARLGGLLSQ